MDKQKSESDPATMLEDGRSPQEALSRFSRLLRIGKWVLSLILAFSMGLGGGYALWGRDDAKAAASRNAMAALAKQVNPPKGFRLPVKLGDLGPQLQAAGAIDYKQFAAVYEQAGHPLTDEQIKILNEGSDQPVVINRDNAHFLLNFLWAVGLANQNPILTEGAMLKYSGGQIDTFASTGGWTIGTKPVTELYASVALIKLTPEQQARVEEVAQAVYRPCCNNPTLFPDCNHGMAMLGLLELMASQEATTDEMFTAAKQVNAFWFPQQTMELAAFFKATAGKTFDQIDPRQAVDANFASSDGFRQVHTWLATNGQLEQAPSQGGGCGT